MINENDSEPVVDGIVDSYHPNDLREWLAKRADLRAERLAKGCFYDGTSDTFCGFCSDCLGDYE